jgi:pyocin large subunit-like protein
VSLHVSDWVRRLPIHSPPKAVARVLADRAHNDGTGAYPSLDTLGFETGFDRATVWRSLAWLEEVGVIEDTGERHGRTRQIIEWRLCIEKSPAEIAERIAERDG